MKIEIVNLNEIKPAKVNVRTHTETQLHEFVRSVKAFGQIRPIVVDEKYTIIAGHGLYEALLRTDTDTASVLVMDNLTETEKRKLMLADNQIFELGMPDNDGIMQILEEINSLSGDFDIPGYDESILDNLFTTSEEVDELISSYGSLSEEGISEVEERRVRVEDRADNQPYKEIHINPDVVEIEQKTPNDSPRPYVTCPSCGERIWL